MAAPPFPLDHVSVSFSIAHYPAHFGRFSARLESRASDSDFSMTMFSEQVVTRCPSAAALPDMKKNQPHATPQRRVDALAVFGPIFFLFSQHDIVRLDFRSSGAVPVVL